MISQQNLKYFTMKIEQQFINISYALPLMFLFHLDFSHTTNERMYPKHGRKVRNWNENDDHSLLQLLLWTQVVCVSTFLLATVGCARMQASIAFTANHLVAVVFLGQDTQRWFDDTTTKTEDQVKCRFLLDVVVTESATIFKLLSSENQSLLIWRNSLFVLDLCLDIFDRVRRLDLECDRLSG